MKPIKTPFDTSSIKKGLDYVKDNGISGVVSKVRYRMTGPGLAYNGWYREVHEPDDEELLRQQEESFQYSPRISVLVPVYLTPEPYLRAMIESVHSQTYSNWELCIVDCSRAKFGETQTENISEYDFVYSLETERIILQLAEKDDRIKYHQFLENHGISGSLEKALSIATGDYVVFLNHDDMLTRDALYEIVKACNEKHYALLYSDEDKCSSDGTKFSDPSFKPDFALDLLRTHNYFGHVVAVERSLAMKVSFRREFEGAEDYDFNLRCVEACVGGFPENPLTAVANKNLGKIKQIAVKPIDYSRIKHISRVLYHSRMKPKSLDESAHKRDLTGELAKKALSQHLDRTVGYATAVKTEMKGILRAVYETPGNPVISIVIPGGSNAMQMQKCIVPLFEKARYSDFEIIIVDTVGDENRELADFYRILEAQRRNTRVINNLTAKNTSEIRNIGAAAAKGEFLLFMDPEVELLEASSIGDMLGNCMRDEVGVVGGTLYSAANYTIYKQGIILGVNGVAAYPNRGIKRGTYGYLMNNCINNDCQAVPASCMMVKTVIFDKLEGFDERLTGDAAAIDFCLKARGLGVLVVSVSDAGWLCSERQRFGHAAGLNEENELLLRERWGRILEAPDPYYNINFTRRGDLFSL